MNGDVAFIQNYKYSIKRNRYKQSTLELFLDVGCKTKFKKYDGIILMIPSTADIKARLCMIKKVNCKNLPVIVAFMCFNTGSASYIHKLLHNNNSNITLDVPYFVLDLSRVHHADFSIVVNSMLITFTHYINNFISNMFSFLICLIILRIYESY